MNDLFLELEKMSRKDPGGRPPEPKRKMRLLAAVTVLCLACFSFFAADMSFKRSLGHMSIKVGDTRQIEPGIAWHEVDLPGGDGTRTLWIYEPQHPVAEKLPCVFIAPSGSTCFYGMKLGDKDRAEHLPLAREGWIVVAYSLDGIVDDRNSNSSVFSAIESFRLAHSGLDNEKAAVDYALKALPAIDTKRIYAAGHSSAATMALMAASNDPRFAGCVAYAPLCDVSGQAVNRGVAVDTISQSVPGFKSFLVDCSPIKRAAAIHCPVYLFHADDDAEISTTDVTGFFKTLSQTNNGVTFEHVPSGGHYDSMIQQGIPRGIAWIKQH